MSDAIGIRLQAATPEGLGVIMARIESVVGRAEWDPAVPLASGHAEVHGRLQLDDTPETAEPRGG